jgi:hypothetical protein
MTSDDSQKTLNLIPKTTQFPEPRNYWNTVGKDKEFFPETPRVESIPTLNKQGRVLDEPKDEWWINSLENQYCFWSYIKSKSHVDGTMEPLLQSEIADLFGCSSTKVHFMLKEAMDKLMSEDNMKILQDLFKLTEEEPTQEAQSTFAISNIEYTDDGETT